MSTCTCLLGDFLPNPARGHWTQASRVVSVIFPACHERFRDNCWPKRLQATTFAWCGLCSNPTIYLLTSSKLNWVQLALKLVTTSFHELRIRPAFWSCSRNVSGTPASPRSWPRDLNLSPRSGENFTHQLPVTVGWIQPFLKFRIFHMILYREYSSLPPPDIKSTHLSSTNVSSFSSSIPRQIFIPENGLLKITIL